MGMITARLFWKLPEPFHKWLSRLTGGWRVVSRQEGTYPNGALQVGADRPIVLSDDDKPLRKIVYRTLYRWERWPNTPEHPYGLRPVEYSKKPW